jgi:CheY-like chemotaxis protein
MASDITVLHIDDDLAFLDLTAELLERVDEDITVCSESDPTKALDRIEAEEIDGVISDYEMPQIDGLDLCVRIRGEYPHIPYFLFTSKPPDGLIDQALSVAMTDFIQKEAGIAHFKVIAKRLRNAVRQSRMQQQLEEASDSM